MDRKPEDAAPNKRIRQMIEFILQEAREKSEEIALKADEEFQIEKGKILNPERVKLQQEYARKFKDLEVKRKIAYSTQVNKARLKVLETRDKCMTDLTQETENRLATLKKDSNSYKALMRKLIVQGLIRIDEDDVEVFVVKEDLSVAKSVVNEAAKEYKKVWKQETGQETRCKVQLQEKAFLPSVSVGGVVLKARRGKIVLDNTLQSRLKVASATLLPILRGKLFGITPHEGVRYEDEDEHKHN